MPTWQAVLVGIIPSIGVGLIFWFAIRSVIRADRNERSALARLEAEQDAADASGAALADAAQADDARAEDAHDASVAPAASEAPQKSADSAS